VKKKKINSDGFADLETTRVVPKGRCTNGTGRPRSGRKKTQGKEKKKKTEAEGLQKTTTNTALLRKGGRCYRALTTIKHIRGKKGTHQRNKSGISGEKKDVGAWSSRKWGKRRERGCNVEKKEGQT